jgi:ergothioneine biosynthesis protein EgtB
MNIKDIYRNVRDYTENLCKPLQIEDYIPQPEAFVSPPKWHLAHTTWFFEAFVLEPYLPDYKRFHEDFSFLFNSYYNAAGDRIFRADRGNITRPGVDEVYAYRKYVDEHMDQLMDIKELDDLIVLGLNHEQQHQELLITDLKFTFSGNPVFPVYKDDFSLIMSENKASNTIAIKEGIYDIGYKDSGFHYDNEKGLHKVYLHDYKIDNFLVRNKDYIDFISDGGYQTASLWLDEGWAWVNSNHIKAPLYWHFHKEQWMQYTLSGLKAVEENQILCHINLYEAAAFAEWQGKRLPTEFEWEAASSQLDWGDRWEWTNSAYLPYPKFKTAAGALGEYNGKFMMNQMVLRGSSQATSPGHSRNTYRNFFHSSARWQCFGIRLAEKQV